MWVLLIDLFITGGNKVNAFNIVRIIWEISTLVQESEMPVICVFQSP